MDSEGCNYPMKAFAKMWVGRSAINLFINQKCLPAHQVHCALPGAQGQAAALPCESSFCMRQVEISHGKLCFAHRMKWVSWLWVLLNLLSGEGRNQYPKSL